MLARFCLLGSQGEDRAHVQAQQNDYVDTGLICRVESCKTLRQIFECSMKFDNSHCNLHTIDSFTTATTAIVSYHEGI